MCEACITESVLLACVCSGELVLGWTIVESKVSHEDCCPLRAKCSVSLSSLTVCLSACVSTVHAGLPVLVLHRGDELLRLTSLQRRLRCEEKGECLVGWITVSRLWQNLPSIYGQNLPGVENNSEEVREARTQEKASRGSVTLSNTILSGSTQEESVTSTSLPSFWVRPSIITFSTSAKHKVHILQMNNTVMIFFSPF